MSFLSALYALVIGPLELFFEIVYAFAYRMIHDPGFSIIFLSLTMNFLVLPLYKRADAMQAEERETEEKLGHWVRHIKKTFKGDERYMILQTYYRQNNYKPTYALKGSVSLLLEIPFFMAAYNFLSGLTLLNGVSFGPISNLGAPDAMFTIGGFTVNVLPILMTAINIVSCVIYTKGLPTRSKVQLYVMAAVFLVLLYDSPAGLVFYWTLNNVFSLVKTLFYKLKKPGFVLSILSSITGAGLLGYLFFRPMEDPNDQMVMIVLLLLLQLPLLLHFVKKQRGPRAVAETTRMDTAVFRLGALFVTLLTGFLIPSAVIHASPEEFISMSTFTNPVLFVLNSGLIAAGTFLVWCSIFYALASPSGKRTMGFAMWLISGAATVDYMFFGRNYGTIAPNLTFVKPPEFPVQDILVNLAAVAAAAVVLWFIWKKKQEVAKFALLAACVAAVGMSAVNLKSIHDQTADKIDQLKEKEEALATIPLSRNGKNVVIFMLDRAISDYVPYIMNEKPELLEQFSGFTYYPNTISFGGYTNFGSPGLFGGYEYTPAEMNKRDTELLVDKHDEAMKVMPVLFDSHDFDVTVCDPSYAGYQWIPDLTIYDDYPGIRAFNTQGKFSVDPNAKAAQSDKRLNRNFFCYSLFKAVPVFLQPTIYNAGQYNEIQVAEIQVRDGVLKAKGISENFMKPYAVLYNLSNMTEFTEKPVNTFMMMSNDTTHEPMLLQEPEYVPAAVVDNRKYESEHSGRFTVNGRTMHMETDAQVIHYQSNMAAFLQLGRWFDYLRENGVYDNTRIILVADHGADFRQFDDLILENGTDVMRYHPLLMVKDFGSEGFTTDERLMTNADVPNLASGGLIDDPVNPFTGKPIDESPKEAEELSIFASMEWRTDVNNGTTYLPADWLLFRDNVFDGDCWRRVGPEAVR